MFARTPCPSFVGCLRATTASNGSPRGTRRRPGANGLLGRHAMHRPPHETRIASRLGSWRRLRAACCRWRRVRRIGQEPCGYRQELFRQYAFRLDPCLRQLAVGTSGVPRGELDGGPTGAPLTRPSAAGVRCRQPRFARRSRRNSTYTAVPAGLGEDSFAATQTLCGRPRSRRGTRLTARRKSNGCSTGLAAGLPCSASDAAGCRYSFGSPRGTFGAISATPVGDGCTRRRLARNRAFCF